MSLPIPVNLAETVKLAGCELQGVVKLVQVTYSLPHKISLKPKYVTLGSATFSNLNSTPVRFQMLDIVRHCE